MFEQTETCGEIPPNKKRGVPEPCRHRTCILLLPQSATMMFPLTSTATPVGALNWPFPSPLEPNFNTSSPSGVKTCQRRQSSCCDLSDTLNICCLSARPHLHRVVVEVRHNDLVVLVDSSEVRPFRTGATTTASVNISASDTFSLVSCLTLPANCLSPLPRLPNLEMSLPVSWKMKTVHALLSTTIT